MKIRKKILLCLVLVIILILPIFLVYAVTEKQVKTVLRRSLFEYFKGMGNKTLNRSEVLDLLEVYFAEEGIEKINLSEVRTNTGRSVENIVNDAIKKWEGCTEGWKCKTDFYKGYQRLDCSWSSVTFCNYGCVNGDCKSAPCTDECSEGQKICDGDYKKTCGNYDTVDSCLEWGDPIHCPDGCRDGACIQENATCDDCSNPNCIGKLDKYGSMCCKTAEDCPVGCVNNKYYSGRCMPLINRPGNYCDVVLTDADQNGITDACEIKCTDSDGGLNYKVKGKLQSSMYPNKVFEDYCMEATTSTAANLGEYYCEDGANFRLVTYRCPNGCQNGACIEESTTCTDTDPNNDIFVAGICSGVNGQYADTCNEGGYAVQYSCSECCCAPTSAVCPSGSCADGACAQIPACSGDICGGNEICPGENISASDTSRCCSKECTIPIWNYCHQCGDGLFNLFCDETECHSIVGCYYDPVLIGDDCKSCSEATCSVFDEMECVSNRCGLDCEWADNGCKERPEILPDCSSYGPDYWCGTLQEYGLECNYQGVVSEEYCEIIGGGTGYCMKCRERNQTCADSDGGIDYNVKGVTVGLFLGGPGDYVDSCSPSNPSLLIEYYCQNNLVEVVEYQCPNGCQDGKCVGGTIIAGGDYYVDKNLVNDCQGTYSITSRDCSGSGGTAYNTIKEAANVAVAGDVVLVRAGIYHETLTPTNSGNSGNLIVFKAYPGEKPIIDGEYVRKTVDLSVKNYIRVEGFEIRYSTLNGVYFKDSSGIEIINNNIHHNDNVDPAVNNYEGHSGIEMSGNINNILIKGNDIHHNYWNGITPFSLSVSNLKIINNDIHDNGNDGIQQGGGSNWLIEGNKIRDQGGMPTAHPDGFQIFRPLNGLIIRGNTFYDHSQNIYMSGPLSDGFIENVEISGNIFYHDDDPYELPRAVYLIDLDDGPNRGFRNVKIFRNTAYGLYFGFLVKGNITNYEIRDNILANIDDRCISVAEGAEKSTSSNYNLFYNWGAIVWGAGSGTWYSSLSSYQTATGQDMNSVEADPKFVNPGNFDFNLQIGSPACTMSSTGSYVGALACS